VAVSHEKRDDNGFAPSYPLDLAPCNFFLFPRMKKGKCFQNVEEVRKKMTEALNAITLQGFQNCFEQWKMHWDKCIASQGQYFEGV
jgi:hypothetical protein